MTLLALAGSDDNVLEAVAAGGIEAVVAAMHLHASKACAERAPTALSPAP